MALRDLVKRVHGPTQLSPTIDTFIERQEQLPSTRESGWHPSSFCDGCPREHVIAELVHIDNAFKVGPRLRRIFDIGTAVHRWYQEEYLGPMGILWGKWRCVRCRAVKWGFMPTEACSCTKNEPSCKFICGRGRDEPDAVAACQESRGGCIHCGVWGYWEFKEIPFKLELDGLEEPVVGHADGLIRLAGVWATLEMKTINSFGFAALKAAKPGHVLQGQAYSELAIRKAVRGLPKGVEVPTPVKLLVLYIGKNTSDEEEFLLDVDRDLGSSLLNKPVEAESAFDTKELPPRHEECEGNKKAQRAKKCAAKNFCFAQNVSFSNLADYGRVHG